MTKTETNAFLRELWDMNHLNTDLQTKVAMRLDADDREIERLERERDGWAAVASQRNLERTLAKEEAQRLRRFAWWVECGDFESITELQRRAHDVLAGSAVEPAGEQMCKHDDGDCHEDDPCDDCPKYRPAVKSEANSTYGNTIERSEPHPNPQGGQRLGEPRGDQT